MIDLKCRIIEEESDLRRVVILFVLIEDRVSMRSYAIDERPTKRHAWRPVEYWSSRSGEWMTLTARPEIPQATKDKAVELIRNQIKYRLE